MGFWKVLCRPASSASFPLFHDRRGKKEAVPESRHSFEVAAARPSGLVSLVFSRQTVFVECEHRFIETNGKCRAIGHGLKLYPEQHAAHAPQRSYSIHAKYLSSK